MFDTIRWDAALPEDHPTDDHIFQTKSLHPCLAIYCVTAEGRLLLAGNGWHDEDFEHAHALKGVDVDFHGDIQIMSAKKYRQYLARFTHGTLEWLRPIADGEPWDCIAIGSMKFYVSSAKQQQNAQPLPEEHL